MKKYACRRCFAKFSNNIKFHQHIQNHHQKKFTNEFAKITSSEIVLSIIFFTSEAKLAKRTSSEFAKFTSKSMIAMSTLFATFTSNESTLMFASFIDRSKTIFDNSFFLISFVTSKQSISTSFATSRKSIFWVEIVSRSVIASKSSRLSIFTSKMISICTKIASIICSSISQTSNSKHQKSYLIIEDLFEMFVEKLTKSNLLHIKKRVFFSIVFSFRQINITFYFRFVAINQSKSINQNSKISNSKNFQQHTFAKSNRVRFTFFILNKWFEKSIVLLYKTSIFFRLRIFEISSILSYKMSNVSCFQSMIAFCKFSTRLFVSSIIRVFSSLFHVCRICCDIFESNNDLHRHLRAIHFDHAVRHESEKHQAFERNIMTWKFLICWRRNKSFSYFFSCIINRFLEEWSHVLVTWHNENVVIFFRWWHLLR